MIDATIASNAQEADGELTICGVADRLVTDLRDRELNGAGTQALTAKGIARHLREPLRLVAKPAGCPSADLVDAGRTIGDAVARVPRMQLLSTAVEHELGAAKFTTLLRFVPTQSSGAAQRETAGAVAKSVQETGHARA